MDVKLVRPVHGKQFDDVWGKAKLLYKYFYKMLVDPSRKKISLMT
jgi:hypothetical protein